jgi:hypothetical protein
MGNNLTQHFSTINFGEYEEKLPIFHVLKRKRFVSCEMCFIGLAGNITLHTKG